MALPSMPTRDPRPGDQPHAREYDPATGGWTRPVTTPNGGGQKPADTRR